MPSATELAKKFSATSVNTHNVSRFLTQLSQKEPRTKMNIGKGSYLKFRDGKIFYITPLNGPIIIQHIKSNKNNSNINKSNDNDMRPNQRSLLSKYRKLPHKNQKIGITALSSNHSRGFFGDHMYFDTTKHAFVHSKTNRKRKEMSNNESNTTTGTAPIMKKAMGYTKLDNPGGGLCSLYSLYGVFGMPHGNEFCRITEKDKNWFLKEINIFNNDQRQPLRRLIHDPSLFSNDSLAGKHIDITNPHWLLFYSKHLSRRLFNQGHKYYIVISPDANLKTDSKIIQALNDSLHSKHKAIELIRKHKFVVMQYSENMNAYVPVEIAEEKFTNKDINVLFNEFNNKELRAQLGMQLNSNNDSNINKYIYRRFRDGNIDDPSVMNALKYILQTKYKAQRRMVDSGQVKLLNSEDFQSELQKGKIPIFRGTGGHWYRFVAK